MTEDQFMQAMIETLQHVAKRLNSHASEFMTLIQDRQPFAPTIIADKLRTDAATITILVKGMKDHLNPAGESHEQCAGNDRSQ
jgi:hypothetical protein